ncbi:unnamed protein product [Cercopithifilaria johnstoni]|uniref:Uncharacterized protein n=1 Tax=Cercopithifilaria johnstoni TaxID=2874296 RepID=A0A8J2MUQ6_9BILA|nr:unnamed protein product [Cercopithifilaria johnstoni]
MKFANGSGKLEVCIREEEKKDMEGAADEPVSVQIIQYDHEPRSRNRSSEETEYTFLQRPQQLFNSETTCLSEKDDSKDIFQPVLAENENPSMVVKATVCVIASIIMVICLCFLFA